MAKADEIKFKNVLYKLDKAMVKIDMLEQENEEKNKVIADLEKKLSISEDINKKAIDVADNKCNQLYNEIAKLNEEILEQKSKKKEYEETIAQLNKIIEDLKIVVEDFKAKKNKNSTNSSKPSSTDNFRKTIQNNRVKSGRKKGGQKGRKGKTLNKVEKVDEVIEVYGKEVCDCGGKIEYNEFEYIEKQLIDLANNIKVLGYRFHKGKCQKCGKEYISQISPELANPVQYSNKVKLMIPVIKNISNMSVETTKNVFGTMFNGLPISTGWIHKQEQKIAKKCEPLIEKMKDYLSMVSVAHADETGARIGDKLGTCISFSDNKVVVYDMFSNKSKESFDEFGIFQKYSGILVHDHNKTYYMYTAMEHAECNAHVTRYLKQVIEIYQRKGAKKLREFLLSIYKEKLKNITEGKKALPQKRINEIEAQYLQIISQWEKEYNEYISDKKRISQTLREEKNLFTRLREYKEEHIKFIKDFKVPFTNNEAEQNLRKIKIKINTSKRFGELKCAKNFAIVKSIIETAKKQRKNILETFSEILKGNLDVFDLELENART